jgi:histidinol dehydrogenase
MKLFKYSELTAKDIQKLVQRNVDPANEIRAVVEEVIANVQQHGDSALIDYAQKFDKVALTKLFLDKAELEELAEAITPEQKNALETAYSKIPPNTAKNRG